MNVDVLNSRSNCYFFVIQIVIYDGIRAVSAYFIAFEVVGWWLSMNLDNTALILLLVHLEIQKCLLISH